MISGPGEGELIEFGGVRHLFKLTGGALGVEEFVLPAGVVGARPHVHEAHDEYFYVLEGELTAHTGDVEVTAGPGTLVTALRGTPHGFRNATGGPVRGLCLYTPPGYENFFRDVHREVAAGTPLTDDLLDEFRRRHRTRPVTGSGLDQA